MKTADDDLARYRLGRTALGVVAKAYDAGMSRTQVAYALGVTTQAIGEWHVESVLRLATARQLRRLDRRVAK